MGAEGGTPIVASHMPHLKLRCEKGKGRSVSLFECVGDTHFFKRASRGVAVEEVGRMEVGPEPEGKRGKIRTAAACGEGPEHAPSSSWLQCIICPMGMTILLWISPPGVGTDSDEA